MIERPEVVIVMGAAVWEGGRASNAMRRRVAGALASIRSPLAAMFVVSGGLGKYPPSEARVMERLLLEAGVPAEHIVKDEAATDTLQSVRNCVEILKSLPAHADVIVSSDIYHIPRCRILFRLYGVRTRSGKVASGRAQNSAFRWNYYYAREFAATTWDSLLVLAAKLRNATA
jgi:vancomycin permeability regulator SanA